MRTNHVDESHAFLVGAALFLGIEGLEELGARVEIVAPRGWRAATALPVAQSRGAGDEVLQFDAPDFDTLVDSPIELGTHREERFEAVGKPHRYAIWPARLVSDADARRLVDDTRAILETEAKFFGGSLPYDAYDLLLHLSPRGRGGLEHNASAALIASPGSFSSRDAYLDLLSLVAHEVFHAWNIKRIRPAGLTPYRYGRECYTRLLWWFEGATSYYDWRVLSLSRLCTIDEYLDHLAAEIAYLDQTPGRLVHALEDASYDAWIKLYRPDENSANSSVSYYRKGEVVCALLDIEIRARSGGRATLDGVLAHLWEEYGARETAGPGGRDAAHLRAGRGRPPGRSVRRVDPLAPGDRLRAHARARGPRARADAARRSGALLAGGARPGRRRAVVCLVGGARLGGVARRDRRWRRAPRGGRDPRRGDEPRGRAPRAARRATPSRSSSRATGGCSPRARPSTRRARIASSSSPGRDAPASARAAFAAWLGQPHPVWAGREGAPTAVAATRAKAGPPS